MTEVGTPAKARPGQTEPVRYADKVKVVLYDADRNVLKEFNDVPVVREGDAPVPSEGKVIVKKLSENMFQTEYKLEVQNVEATHYEVFEMMPEGEYQSLISDNRYELDKSFKCMKITGKVKVILYKLIGAEYKAVFTAEDVQVQ